jgi:hypothetical protein
MDFFLGISVGIAGGILLWELAKKGYFKVKDSIIKKYK